MSPIIHAEIGWLVAQPLARRRDRILVTCAAVVSDFDGLGLLISEDLYVEWHHRLGHGLAAALAVLLGVGVWTRSWRAASLATVAFHSHLLGDFVGSGPGWPLFYWWPFANTEWLPTWQWDLASWQNGVIGGVVTLAALGCAVWTRRTPVEVFSLRADAAVVAAVRNRLGV